MENISGVYRHYKGNVYRVLCVARHSETLEYMVVYQDTTDSTKIWARPLDMWNDDVVVNGTVVKRFAKIDE